MRSRDIEVGTTADGTRTYFVNWGPADLPAVRPRDLAAAWDWAHDAAEQCDWGGAIAFRFNAAGRMTVLALSDPDARCWAAAVDRAVGMSTAYGLAVCLRLLALIDLLTASPRVAGMVAIDAGGATLHPALLRLAAEASLTEDVCFDVGSFCAGLPHDGSGRRATRSCALGSTSA